MHWIALLPDSRPDSRPDRPDNWPDNRPDNQPAPGHGTEAAAALPADPLVALGWQALQFTPKVARVRLLPPSTPAAASAPTATATSPATSLSIPAPEALLMEVSASERLFGGRQALLAQLFKEKGPFVHIKHARAATSLIALARLQLAPPLPGAADLPLATLLAARPHLATLARLGCTTWGQLRALPRGGVVRRFGAELLDALDRAWGLKPELYPWLTLPEVFDEKIELHAQVETAPALMFGAQRLLKQLHLWLQLRNVGVTALEFGWTMDARRSLAQLAKPGDANQGALTLRTAEATQDITHLQRLLGENLARLQLPAPALYVHLRTVHTEALATHSAPLLLEDLQKGDNLHQMLERLSARLGPQAVQGLKTHADHRPEYSQNYDLTTKNALIYNKLVINNIAYCAINTRKLSQKNKINDSKIQKSDSLHPDALHPTWLLHPPLALAVLHHTPHYQGPLTLLAGPQRLEAGWWGILGQSANPSTKAGMAPGKNPTEPLALRDYFIAQSEQAGLLWVFKQRLGEPAQWFLQGLFD